MKPRLEELVRLAMRNLSPDYVEDEPEEPLTGYHQGRSRRGSDRNCQEGVCGLRYAAAPVSSAVAPFDGRSTRCSRPRAAWRARAAGETPRLKLAERPFIGWKRQPRVSNAQRIALLGRASTTTARGSTSAAITARTGCPTTPRSASLAQASQMYEFKQLRRKLGQPELAEVKKARPLARLLGDPFERDPFPLRSAAMSHQLAQPPPMLPAKGDSHTSADGTNSAATALSPQISPTRKARFRSKSPFEAHCRIGVAGMMIIGGCSEIRK
jgi:hypothetical protein